MPDTRSDQAVAHMHRQQLLEVHGELQLENVLLAGKAAGPAGRCVAKLTDLGGMW